MYRDKPLGVSRIHITGKQDTALSIRCDLGLMVWKDFPDHSRRIVAMKIFQNDDGSLFLDYTT
jgi:hypothetical protein